MSEYIRAVGAAVILGVLTDMLVPEGGFKKYCRAVCGMAVVAIMLSPLTGGFLVDFSAEEQISALDISAAEASARERVLARHRKNLELAISDALSCEAEIETDDEGNPTLVRLEGVGDETEARKYVKRELGIEGSDVKINEAEGSD